MKLLLLEDDFALNCSLVEMLKTKGFTIDAFTDGDAAASAITRSLHDLYLLDINVPTLSGHDILQLVRECHPKVPVIMMSVMNDIDVLKTSYRYGCDDYLRKPFEFEELMLRIDYALKKNLASDGQFILLRHGYAFDLEHQILKKNDQEVELTAKEQLMMALFVKNLGGTVSSEVLREYVWNGAEVESVSIRTVVHKLKNKLKSGMLVNMRGVGYKLLK